MAIAPISSFKSSSVNFRAESQNSATNLDENKTAEDNKKSKLGKDALMCGLVALALGAYVVHSLKNKNADVDKLADKLKNGTVHSEKLRDDVQFYMSKINSMVGKFNVMPPQQPKLKSENIYKNLSELPFNENKVSNFLDGKLIDDNESVVRKYISDGKEVARMEYKNHEPYRYIYMENGKPIEKISFPSEATNADKTIEIWNNSENKQTYARYRDGKLEEWSVNTPLFKSNVTVSSNSLPQNVRMQTFDKNGVVRKDYKLDFDSNGKLENIDLKKNKPTQGTFADSLPEDAKVSINPELDSFNQNQLIDNLLSANLDAKFSDGKVINARRTKWDIGSDIEVYEKTK